MKTLKVKITPYDLPSFKFASSEDCVLFYDIVPTSIEGYHAWDCLRDNGWYHKNNDENGFLVWMFPENDIDLLNCMMIRYDWYYEMSDSYSVFCAGEAYDKKIDVVMARVGEPLASNIWNQYAPDDRKKE